MRKIFIFRHGETHWNREGRFQGQLDVPLNETGRSQAANLAGPLGEHRIEAILSSDLGRAYETARIVASRLAIPVFIDRGLREAALGEAEGKTTQEIMDRYGMDLLHRWRSVLPTDADVSYPGGETGAEVAERSFQAIERFIAEKPFTRFGVACHGGVIRRVMHKILTTGQHIPIPNGVVYPITYDPKAKTPWTTVVPE